MKRKAIFTPLLFLLILFPAILVAKDQDTLITAEQVTVKSGNILYAKGNVKIQRGNVSIVADEMTVDNKENKIDFRNIREFFDGNEVKIEAQEALLSKDLSNGIIYAAQVLIDDTLRIRAGKVELKDNLLYKASEIDRITSCEDCKNGVPLWNFTASSASNDPENQNIVYRNVTMRVVGVPISYIPYLRLPSPGVDRARGFLAPTSSISSNLGVGVKVPYFVPIGESRDLLITPFLSTKTRTTEYRYRQKFSNGDFAILGAFSDDKISLNKIRSYYKVLGKFELSYGVNLDIKAGHVNDETYLSDYGYSSNKDLNTKVSLSKLLADKKVSFNSQLDYVRAQQEAVNGEYYSLTGEYQRRVEQTFLPGSLSYDVSWSSALNINQGNEINRPPSSVALELQYADTKNVGSLQLSNQTYARLSSFVNSEDTNSFEEELISQYGSSYKLAIPMKKTKNDTTSLVSPIFMISYNGQEKRTRGSSFIGHDELTLGNLYSGKKYSSLSESELGISVSSGFDYSIAWAKKQKLNISFGSLWYQDATYMNGESKPLEPKKLKFVSNFQYMNREKILMSGRAIISEKGDILRGQLKSELSERGYRIMGRYEFLDMQLDKRLEEDLKNFELNSLFETNENLDLNLSGRYDLAERAIGETSYGFNIRHGLWKFGAKQSLLKEKDENTEISAIYDDKCTRVLFKLQNKKETLSSSDSIKSISVIFQLKPFASFSVPGI